LVEIDRHPIKELSRLRICVHALVAEGGNGNGAFRQLRYENNDQCEHGNGDEHFGQRKSAFAEATASYEGYGVTGSAGAATLLGQRKRARSRTRMRVIRYW
jgi:hypothetical protein